MWPCISRTWFQLVPCPQVMQPGEGLRVGVLAGGTLGLSEEGEQACKQPGQKGVAQSEPA